MAEPKTVVLIDSSGSPIGTGSNPLSVSATFSGTLGAVDQGLAGTALQSWYVRDGSGLLATAALQTTGNASLASIDGKLSGPLTVGGTVAVSNFPATQPISAASLPLPSGAAKDSTLTDGSLRVGGSVAVTGTFWQATQPVSGTVAVSNAFALDSSVTGLQVSQGSTTSGQKGGLVLGAATTAAPSYSNGQTSPLSLTLAGALRVDGSAVTQPATQVDRTATGTLSSNGATTSAFSCAGVGAVVFYLSNSGTSTITFEYTADGSTWASLTVYNYTGGNISLNTVGTTATSGGVWMAPVAGLTAVRLRVSSYSSGTVTYAITGNQSTLIQQVLPYAYSFYQTSTADTNQPVAGGSAAVVLRSVNITQAWTGGTITIYNNITTAMVIDSTAVRQFTGLDIRLQQGFKYTTAGTPGSVTFTYALL